MSDSFPPKPTMAVIAEQASVSLSTVSKVLNGRKGVSAGTRERVEQLLHEHGYLRPGDFGRSGGLIEVVVEQGLSSMWALEIVRGVEAIARQQGLSIVLTQTQARHDPGAAWIDGVARRRPVAVILVLTDLSADHKRRLQTRNIPFVLIDPAGSPDADVSSVGATNWAGGVAATEYLISLGHRELGIITGPSDMLCTHARLSGFRHAVENAGLSLKPGRIVPGDFTRDSGVAAGLRLLGGPDRPSAVFCSNDMEALGVYEAARRLGLSIPDDVSVVGFDDIPLAGWITPGLTTITQPLEQMASEAVKIVLRAEDAATGGTRLELATKLKIRESTAPPAKSFQ
ncbi:MULTISPECIES: LacI family DNA-binding transcriptional regulator [Pseudoclavibacter]|uniref:LacI family DNA-binding transcriptional regulator n=1 Tax=Pseudoclavibacter TaxID=255204 RepID=UPI001BAD52E6|nr:MULTISPECIES: LacI family DNA-binding transcriptional regulator [Pseudoclavibacter]MBS3178693.1 LacI family DNA-binding transcriptional regulator [Pseudoclavibacter sp. Marseille-Q4354]